MNPHVVPPSQHTVFMRGFHPNTEMNKIRDFFTKEGGKCSFDFFKISQDGTRLFVALRFESKDVAKEILSRYDNVNVLGSKITVSWFKDLRRARLKALQNGQQWTNFHPKNGFGRARFSQTRFGNRMTSRRQTGKFDDGRSTSSSYSRSRSRSYSKERSRSRSRSWSRSRSRSVSPRYYQSHSSSSSGTSERLKREKNDDSFLKKIELPPEKSDEQVGWQMKKKETLVKSPASSQEPPISSESASSSSSGKERKKKKKKHHRSRHRRHKRRRHHRQRDSTDEDGQLTDYEDMERTPTPDEKMKKRQELLKKQAKEDDQFSVDVPSQMMIPKVNRYGFYQKKPSDNVDRELTVTRDALLKEVNDLTVAVTSGTRLNPTTVPTINNDVKSLLEKFKSTMKPIHSPQIVDRMATSFRTTHIVQAPQPTKSFECTITEPPPDQSSKNGLMIQQVVRSGSTTLSLTNEQIKLVNRKRAELEAAYRQDCDTFATVVKMLIRKDGRLEDCIQHSLHLNLNEIGRVCIDELKQYIETIASGQM